MAMIWLFSLTTFISSFLLFTIQLIVGKRILPWFGGVASIWTTSMLFFMLALFFGYLYVNILSRLPKKKQIRLHLSLVAITFICVLFNFLWQKTLIFPNPIFQSLSPMIQILSLIFLSVGMPFFLLSTTSTLLQYWFAHLFPKENAYSLYVVSNIGSLLGLLSYPFLIEPGLPTTSQEILWLILFCIYIFFILKIILLFNSSKVTVKLKVPVAEKVTLLESVPWLGLSTVSNFALLATTSSITQSVSPVPLLWIAPLAIFLVTYIIAFTSSKWYSRDFHGTLMISAIVASSLMISSKVYIPFWTQISMTLFTLFMINIVCHAELYLSRPISKSLVPFYVSISLGGVLASIACAIIAPLFFRELWEFPLSLIFAVFVFLLTMLFQQTVIQLKIQHVILCLIVIVIVIFKYDGIFLKAISYNEGTLRVVRNFYGVLSVTQSEFNGSRFVSLLNGKILHGNQNFNPGFEFEPTTYYTRDSGAGLVVDKNSKRLSKKSMRVGVIGLGAGTMAGYCLPGDYFRFYEINPNVIDISKTYFSYIAHCEQIGGAVDIIEGDARLSLQKEKDIKSLQQFDVLVVDAFTDDAIPVHLITSEALELFVSHLAPDGIVAFHISNQHLNLKSVLEQLVVSQKLYSSLYQNQGSTWYSISKSKLNQPFEFSTPTLDNKMKIWTDDYSNILKIIY